ncbi:MAG: PEP-CTERM sorting domain-containing protein [Halobacteriota archaeon]
MNKLIARLFAAGALASSLAAMPVHASSITWNLQDVTFSDSTSATGSFTIDWNNRTWSSFDIATQDGRLPAFDYTPENSGLYFNGFGPNSFSIIEGNGRRYITFAFDQALTTAGTYAINTANSWDCNNCSTYRMVTAGSVTSDSLGANVPEPSSLALLLPALGLISLARRKQK